MFEKLKALVPIVTCQKSRANDDFLIVMNEDTEIFFLNDTAKYIYESIDSKKSINDLLELLSQEYEMNCADERELLQHDLISIVRDFQWQNIITLMEV